MDDRIKLSYFYGKEAEQYLFYKIPKLLFTDDYFKKISVEAKVLYGLMLDRMSLSVKNQWMDEEGRAYIYYSLEDIMDALGCSNKKAISIMKELDMDAGIRENIELDILRERHPYDQDLLEGIFDLILETVLCKNESIIVASNKYPAELVRSKFLKLNSSHVEYAIDCFKGNTTKVRNIKKYLLTTLFNAPSTISGYYQAAVNHDYPQYAVVDK